MENEDSADSEDSVTDSADSVDVLIFYKNLMVKRTRDSAMILNRISFHSRGQPARCIYISIYLELDYASNSSYRRYTKCK